VHGWALDLLRVPSPTGDSRHAAEYYAECLRELGLAVTFDEELPDSPSVVAYLEAAIPAHTRVGRPPRRDPVADDPPLSVTAFYSAVALLT